MAERARGHAAAVVGGLAALLLTAPLPSTAVAQLAGAATATDPTGPLVAAVALLAWAVTGWLVLTVALVLLSRLPGLLGRSVHALAGRIAPAAVRRAVEAALGLTVAVSALAPTAALAAPVPAPAASASLPASDAWDFDWPSRAAPPSAVGATPDPVGPASPAPTPASSSTPVAPAPSRPAPTRPAVTVPVPVPVSPAPVPVSPAAPQADVRPSPAAPDAAALVVRAGDSLWSLAEASLRAAGTTHPTDGQVARAWPRWWEANREAIGDDPDLLLPGTVLRPPDDRPGGG